jgi:hypothetical protein
MTRAAFEASRRPEGANFVGSPTEVAPLVRRELNAATSPS